jgi:hypothetical protein
MQDAVRRFEAKMAAVLNDQWRGCSWEVAELGARCRRRSRGHHTVCMHACVHARVTHCGARCAAGCVGSASAEEGVPPERATRTTQLELPVNPATVADAQPEDTTESGVEAPPSTQPAIANPLSAYPAVASGAQPEAVPLPTAVDEVAELVDKPRGCFACCIAAPRVYDPADSTE